MPASTGRLASGDDDLQPENNEKRSELQFLPDIEEQATCSVHIQELSSAKQKLASHEDMASEEDVASAAFAPFEEQPTALDGSKKVHWRRMVRIRTSAERKQSPQLVSKEEKEEQSGTLQLVYKEKEEQSGTPQLVSKEKWQQSGTPQLVSKEKEQPNKPQPVWKEEEQSDEPHAISQETSLPQLYLPPLLVHKKQRKQPIQEKPVKRSKKTEEKSYSDELSSDSDGLQVHLEKEKKLVTPGGEQNSGVVSSEQNKIRREIVKTKLVKNGQIFTLPITILNRPPLDPRTGCRPLEIREPHQLHVQNLKKKMKINPHATVVPFLVMVNPDQCDFVAVFDSQNPEKYEYYVIGGLHSAEARRQLVKEHPTTYFFKYAECKIYVGLTIEESKLLAWDHNNDNAYRQKMSSIERIRFFHCEYKDALHRYGPRLHPGLRKQCLIEVGIVVDDAMKSDGLRKYEPWFQLAFRDGVVWDLQEQIFTMWENKEVKGQKLKKGKIDPQVAIKGRMGEHIDLTIEEAAEDMMLSPWRALQGIKDERVLISVLSRVISKELSFDEMVNELLNHKVHMKIQDVMMKRLDCRSWEQVREEYPTTSSNKMLQEYFMVFKGWKPSRRKGCFNKDIDCPSVFNDHIERARQEKSRLEAKKMDTSSNEDNESLKPFMHFASSSHSLHYGVFCGDVAHMSKILPRKEYTLMISDVPHGFRIAGSTYDEEPFRFKQLQKMVKDFAELTTAPLWRIVIFHSRAQSYSVEEALLSACHSIEGLSWVKTNVVRGPSFRFVSCSELMTVGYYDKISKKRIREHCNESGIPSVFHYPAVTKKLRHVVGDKSLVNPYQKPQRLINRLIELFSNIDDWILDLFSGTGTTIACSLKMFRNCISLEKDEAQVSFTKMRIHGIWECPDADQEVGAKHVGNTDRFQIASREPMEPLGREPGELGELKEDSEMKTVLDEDFENEPLNEKANKLEANDALLQV